MGGRELKRGQAYLSKVFHDEGAFLDLLQGFDAPTSAIRRAKNAKLVHASLLHDPIVAAFITQTPLITFVDRIPGSNPHTAESIVRKRCPRRSRTAFGLVFQAVAFASASHNGVIHNQVNPLPDFVIMDEFQIGWRAFQINQVLHNYRSWVFASRVDCFLPGFQGLQLGLLAFLESFAVDSQFLRAEFTLGTTQEASSSH